MFVLDTNTLVYFFRERSQVVERVKAAVPGELIIPTVVLYELQVGITKSTSPQRRTQSLERLTRTVNVRAFDRKAAVAAAQVRVALERQGRPIGPVDMLIAGVAISLDATLVTHNTGEFSRVEGLNLADWF